ncbi:MAG TPA: hypothetical protein VGJ57_12335 [Nitrospirales bacterium]|jgi:hypothetical protein
MIRLAALQAWLDAPFRAPPETLRTRTKIFLTHTLAFGVLSLLLLFRNRDQILFTGDLYHFFINIIKQLDKAPFLSQTANVLVYGNVDYGLNPRILPAFLLARLVPDNWTVVAVYTGFSIEIFAAVFLASWLLRLPTLVAALSAWTACLAFLPYGWPYIAWVELSIIIPGLYTVSALFILFTGLFFQVGQGSAASAFVIALLLVLIALYSVMALVQFTVLLFFMLAWSCLGATLLSSTWKEMGMKTLSGLLLVLAFWLLGIFNYLESYYRYNWIDLLSLDPGRPLMLFFQRLSGLYDALGNFDFYQAFHIARSGVPAWISKEFAIFTLVSFGVSLFFFLNRRDSSLFRFLILFLVTLGGYLTWQWAYLEAIMAPLWAVMFSIGIVILYRLLSFLAVHSRRSEWWDYVSHHLARRISVELSLDRMIVLVVIGILVWSTALHLKHANLGWPSYRYAQTPPGEIYPFLSNNIGLQRTEAFRGRLANIARTKKVDVLPDGRQYIYEAQQNLDHDIAFAITRGADFRHSTMVNAIPTLFDVSRFVAPGTVATMNYFLTEPTHYKQPQFLYPSRYDARWMAFFGIRYVIHNELIDSAPPPLITQRLGEHSLYLYEIPHPNIGNYSPTEVVFAGSLSDALEIMADQEFDFRKKVVADQLIPASLVSTAHTRLNIVRGQLDFQATSSGWSLVVLPFEFSRCLRVSQGSKFTGHLPTLHRVNAHQIGVLFERETAVIISFVFGPLENAGCRAEDAQDWRALGVREAGSFRGVDIRGGPAKPSKIATGNGKLGKIFTVSETSVL